MAAADVAAPILIICPGIHGPALTADFVAALEVALVEASLANASPASLAPASSSPTSVTANPDCAAGALDELLTACWILPPELPPYSPHHVEAFVQAQWQGAAQRLGERWDPETPLIWLAFSAGVVGAIAAARTWQRQGPPQAQPSRNPASQDLSQGQQRRGGRVRRFIALDGWGVPLGRAFPCYRFSHDRFTALSCEALGRSQGYFYATPAVDHLSLWRSPDCAWGHWVETDGGGGGDRCSAIQALARLILA